MANKFELNLKRNSFQSSRLYELYNIARIPSNTFHVYNGGTEAHYTVIEYGYYLGLYSAGLNLLAHVNKPSKNDTGLR